ncbi:similar to Saccharomyces cerevisiae YIR038C GTT1 ER associated glutathione S-transferase capable of homodimerization [Maudiozyma saulgeensis]|uniref:glutathione transferase n=1 Tax=Maudiozyma saulgeensis TaxID=1789683 RepID=A0A1X7RB15_9SACH|nr:similar to Saccharomyces cerevisiae YIR038C GTT1 ER associated glutathione S-transferase capable of homodimerization [Kazachstania saulgeensis]
MSKITLHYLDKSRAFRVLWLLEHLGLEYNVVPYVRENNRAPEELKKIHPLGRSPILEIKDEQTGKTKIVTESGYIFQYILENYDQEKILSLKDPEQAEQVQYYLHYAEGSLQPPLLMEYVYSLAAQSPGPFPLSYLVRGVLDKISGAYSRGEVKNQIDYLETEVSKNEGYFVGGQFSAADILLSFPLQMAFLRGFAQAKDYPHIKKWLESITSEKSYSAAKDSAAQYES